MARENSFRAMAGDAFVVEWPTAGSKTYNGIALVRSQGGKDVAMFRLSAQATPAEYRSLAAAATELAKLAEQCAVVAETAGPAALKLNDSQKARVRDGLKNADAKGRMAIALALGITLEDYGYATATGKSIAEKAPTPPPADAADKLLASVLPAGK